MCPKNRHRTKSKLPFLSIPLNLTMKTTLGKIQIWELIRVLSGRSNDFLWFSSIQTTWRLTQGHSTSQRTSQSWLELQSILSVTRELMAVDWLIRLPLQHLLDQQDTLQSSRQANRPCTLKSQDGLFLKLAASKPKWRSLTRIRLMTLEVASASSKFLKTKRHRKHTLEHPVENTWRSWELSRTWCRVEPVSNVTFQNGEDPYSPCEYFLYRVQKIQTPLHGVWLIWRQIYSNAEHFRE